MNHRWSREHLIRRIDRYYLLAAAVKQIDLRTHYLTLARQYRRSLAQFVPA